MDLNTLNKLWDAAMAENKENESKVINYVKEINALVNENTEIRVMPNLECKYDKTVCIEFLQPDGKAVFGADISFRVSRPYSTETRNHGEFEFSMGCSTMGRVSRAEAPYQVCRCYLMAELWKREQDTIELFKSLKDDAYQEATKAQREYDKEQREIERAAEQKLMDEIRSKLVVGYKFSEFSEHKGDTIVYDFTIERITPKRYYLNYIEHLPETRYFYDTELKKHTKLNHGVAHKTYTGYISAEKLQNVLLMQAQNSEGWYVNSCIEGITFIKSDFEVRSTEDLPEEEQW